MKFKKQLQQKYNKLYYRLLKAIQTKKFTTYSITQQQAIYCRLHRYKTRLQNCGITVASITTLFFTPIIVNAQTPIGNEFQVNTYTIGNQTKPNLAIDDDGDFIIVWVSREQDGSQDGVYAQLYYNNGATKGSEFLVNTITLGNQSKPRVAMDSDGDFVVVWRGYDSSSSGIFAQRYNQSGITQGNEFQVNTYTRSTQNNQKVAMNSNGDFIVVWESGEQNGSRDIYAQRYNNNGIMQGSEFQINTYMIDHQNNSDVAMDDNGDFVVVWESKNQDGSNYGIYAQRYNSNGTAEGNEFQVNTYTTNNQGNPSVAMDSDGNFVVIWQSYEQDGEDYGIYAQRYNSSGVAQGIEFRANTYTTNDQRNPSIAMSNNGEFIITWESSNGQDGSFRGIYAQLYTNNGVAKGNEFQVNTYTTGEQRIPYIAIDSNENFVITWESYGQDGNYRGIYAQRYESSIVSTHLINVAANNVTFYPNPVQDVLTIENGEGFATVYNTLGQPLRQFEITNAKYFFNTDDLPKGIYTLQVRKVDGRITIQQFVK